MLSARLILLVSATNLICDDSLGGEPNDKIDQVLAVMVKMSENVETLKNKVNGMEKKVNGIEETVSDVKKQINVVDAKVEKVDTDVIRYNTWKFVDRGHPESADDYVYKAGTTMKECLEFCQTKRMKDGGEWNGVVWHESSRQCYCEKNDRGHQEDSDWLHFRAQ